MEQTRFNTRAFYAALNAQRETKGLSWRQVASEAGVGHATFTRVKQGKLPDAEHFAALLYWLGVNPQIFMPGTQPKESGTLTLIASLLHNDPCLTEENAVFIDTLVRNMYKTLCKDSLP